MTRPQQWALLPRDATGTRELQCLRDCRGQPIRQASDPDQVTSDRRSGRQANGSLSGPRELFVTHTADEEARQREARGREGFEGEAAAATCVRGVPATRYSPDSCYCSASGVMLQTCASSPGRVAGMGSHSHLRKDSETLLSARVRCGVVRFPCLWPFGSVFSNIEISETDNISR